VERYKRLDKYHHDKKLLDDKRPKQRLKSESILDAADSPQEKYRFPESRGQLSLFEKDHSPHMQTSTAKIHTEFGKILSKMDSNLLELITKRAGLKVSFRVFLCLNWIQL